MIIKLHESFERLEDNELLPYSEIFGHLLDAHANKWHLFTCSRALARKFSKLPNLSDRQRASAENIFQQFGQVSSLVEDAPLLMIVYDPTTMSRPNGNGVISVDINLFGDPNRLFPVQILVEDSRYDRFVIDNLLDALQSTNVLPQAPFKVRYRHCGGSGYPAVLSEILEAEQMFACVVDTDKKCVHSSEGETLNAVKQYLSNSGSGNSALSIVLTTPSREIENLIPPEVFEDIWANTPERQAKISSIKRMFPNWPDIFSHEKDIYLFFDFKKGYSIESTWNCANRDEEAFKERMSRVCDGRNIPGLSNTIIQEIIYSIENSKNKARSKRHASSMFRRNKLNTDAVDFISHIFSLSIHNASLI